MRKAESKEEKEAEREVEQKFKTILEEADTKKRDIITEEMVEIAIKEMKNKKVPDRYGWKAEWVKNGGKEMTKSLTVLFNKIEEEKCVSKQWGYTTIKSVRKNSKEKIHG